MKLVGTYAVYGTATQVTKSLSCQFRISLFFCVVSGTEPPACDNLCIGLAVGLTIVLVVVSVVVLVLVAWRSGRLRRLLSPTTGKTSTDTANTSPRKLNVYVGPEGGSNEDFYDTIEDGSKEDYYDNIEDGSNENQYDKLESPASIEKENEYQGFVAPPDDSNSPVDSNAAP